jgi:hypothetical protein
VVHLGRSQAVLVEHHTAEFENIAAVNVPMSEQRVHHLLHATQLGLAPTALLLDLKAPKKLAKFVMGV